MADVTRQLMAGRMAVAVVGLVAAVSAALGWWRVAVAGVGILGAVSVILLLNMSSRRGVEVGKLDGVANVRTQLLTQEKPAGTAGVTWTQNMALDEAIRAELATMTDQVRATQDRLARLEESMPTLSQRKLTTIIKDQTREVEALLQLYAKIDPREPMPPSGRWALNPQSLLSLFALVRQQRPRVVVELGSGTSTVWLGYALADHDLPEGARLISLDHDPMFADQSRASAARHADRTAPTDVRFAPLKAVRLGDEEYQWYDLDALADLDAIDLLIVDGPPGSTGPLARYPALPLLVDRLADGALVVLDDAGRDDEKKIAERWLQVSGLVQEWSPVGRQAVFRFGKIRRPE